MGVNVTYTYKIPRVAHGNGHTAIGLRIRQDQFRLLNRTICLPITGHGHKSSERIILEKYKFQNILLQDKYNFIIKYNYIYTIGNI